MHTIDTISIEIDGGGNLLVNPEQQEHWSLAARRDESNSGPTQIHHILLLLGWANVKANSISLYLGSGVCVCVCAKLGQCVWIKDEKPVATCTFLCICPLTNVCALLAVQYMYSSVWKVHLCGRSGCQCLTQGGRLSRPLHSTQLCRSVTDP